MIMMGLLSLFLDMETMDYSACIYSFLQKILARSIWVIQPLY